jgi:hypothetical protein
MPSTTVNKTEADKLMDFICETKDGKYTAEKPDLTYIIYSRLVIQEGDANNIFDDSFDGVILYGISD